MEAGKGLLGKRGREEGGIIGGVIAGCVRALSYPIVLPHPP